VVDLPSLRTETKRKLYALLGKIEQRFLGSIQNFFKPEKPDRKHSAMIRFAEFTICRSSDFSRMISM
jgi:hypothetical protein